MKKGSVSRCSKNSLRQSTRSETSGGGGVFEPRTIQNAFLHLHLDHPSPPTKVGRPFSSFPNRAPSTVGRHADLWRPGAGQCAVQRAAAATSPRAPGFRYILPRWVEAARAAAAGRGRKMVPSVLLPAFAAPRRTGGAPVREAAQVAGRCAPAG